MSPKKMALFRKFVNKLGNKLLTRAFCTLSISLEEVRPLKN